ncbi:MAG: hypothetical protein IKZ13_02765 [Akkermansia sp.]|nr:hypothetical protein [Akkermansia sp.]
MKALHILPLIPLVLGAAVAQMPNSFDASGRSTQAQSGVTNDDPNRVGETPPPQIFGMELPLLDPSNDTMSYGGGKFDIGNNALVRERFEKYLSQAPDDTEQSRLYRKNLEEILRYTQRYTKRSDTIGSKTLVKIGTGLYDLSAYPGDGGQAGALASAIVSALDVQRANRRRDNANAELDKEIDKLISKTNTLTNQNTQKGSRSSKTGRGGGGSGYTSHTYLIAANTSKIAEKKAKQGANEASSQASLPIAKVNYQAVVVGLLLQRRYDHAVIGARVYRHVFKDGNTRVDLDKESDAYKMFTGISGMPPTINTIDTMASNARREVDQSIDAVYGALAQNKLGEATNRLITAVATGEYMQSVATFPAKERQRIAEYWRLRKRALTSLNARDYATVEQIATEMKKMDVDFDDSLLLTHTTGKKRQSDFALRAAQKALREGNEEEFKRLATEAAIIWPRNPNLDKGEKEIARLDSYEPQKEEFRVLYDRKDFRTIYKERERFEVVAFDPELKKKYTEVIEHVGRIDAMLAELKSVAEQDRTIGPSAAYEKLYEMKEADSRYAEDKPFMDEFNRYASEAHDFVTALRDAADAASRSEYGSALSCYYRARCFFPKSNLANKGIKTVTQVIVDAQY